MTALVLAARRPRDPLADDGFEVSYVPDGGAEHRVPLVQASAVPLEQGGDGCLQPPVPTLRRQPGGVNSHGGRVTNRITRAVENTGGEVIGIEIHCPGPALLEEPESGIENQHRHNDDLGVFRRAFSTTTVPPSTTCRLRSPCSRPATTRPLIQRCDS